MRLNSISFLWSRYAAGSKQRLVATMNIRQLEVEALCGARQAAMAEESCATSLPSGGAMGARPRRPSGALELGLERFPRGPGTPGGALGGS